VNGTPLAVTAAKAAEVSAFLAAVAAGERMTKGAARQKFGAARRPSPMQGGGVAIVPIHGTIVHRMDGMYSSLGTSMERLVRQIDAAEANDDVAEIIFDVDSPGGFVSLVGETAERIRAMKKPTTAVINTQGCSAAYDLAAAADEVVISPSGEACSIGVFMVHMEFSEMAEREGIRHTVIKFGANKAEGNPYEPLSPEALAHMQEQVDEFGTAFVARVAKHRGVTPAQVRELMGDGRSLTAKQAVKAKAADRVASFEDVLAERGVRRSASARAAMELPARAALAATAGWNVDWRPLAVAPRVQILVPSHLAAAEPTTEEPEMCPDCGEDLDGEGACPECADAEAASVTPMSETPRAGVVETPPAEQAQAPPGGTQDAASTETTEEPSAGGAAAPAANDPPASQPAPEARSSTMAENMEQVPAAGATAVQDTAAAVAAERQRISEVTAMAMEYNVDATTLAAWQNNPNATLGSVSQEILRRNKEADAARPSIAVGADRATTRAWSSFGEQLTAIAEAARPGGRTDPRLYAASGASAGVGSDGGFLIQKDFSSEVYEKAYETGILASRCDQVEISENSDGLEVPYIDETSRANGSRWGGVRVYRRAEAATVTASKPALGKFEVRLEDLMGIAYATGRLLQDATALEQVMTRAFSSEFAFKLDDEIIRGTGAGECLGVLNSPALVSVAKETGQTADTIVAENVQKIWARTWARSRTNGVWLYNQECEPQLQSMQIGTGTSAQLVYLPAGGLSGQQFATIYGRPALPIEQASALGDLGDIMFVDLAEYALIRKGGMQADQSMHVRFIYDEMAFRFIMRVNGKPKWASALTPFKGSGTQSPFVALAARA
jgi:HK97 family phage major capsid protein